MFEYKTAMSDSYFEVFNQTADLYRKKGNGHGLLLENPH